MDSRTKSLNSPELIEKFSSFEVKIPADPSRKSFVQDVLDDRLENLVTEIRYLSRGIVLHVIRIPEIPGKLHNVQPVRVFEVDVARDKDILQVHIEEFMENIPNVIVIHSKSMQVVDAKFKVYRTFEMYLEPEQIFLHHEYEDSDDIVRWIASQKIAKVSAYVQLTMDSFSKEHLASVINFALYNSLTRQNIRNLCCDVYIKTKEEDVGSVGGRVYACHLTTTVRRLKQILVEETLKKAAKFLGTEICDGILRHIEIVVQGKLTEDLIKLRSRISEEIHARFEISITAIIFYILPSVVSVFFYIGVFVFTIIYPIDVNSREWREKIADEIFEKIRDHKQDLTTHILEEMISIWSKTVDDLTSISIQLSRFKTEIFHMDQKQMIEQWKEKENFDKSRLKLENHRSFLQYIAGHNDDGDAVVKVFLRGKQPTEKVNPDIKRFRECFDTTTGFILELVYIGTQPDDVRQNVKAIRDKENEYAPFDQSTKQSLREIVQKHEDKIYARYSAVIGIGISQVRYVEKTIQKEPCIVLYCLDKKIIPFGENPLPKKLEHWPCDIREDFVMFGHCPTACPASDGNLPEPGCSIGIAEVESTGTVGFLVEFNDGCGFLTASHVVERDYETLYKEEIVLANHRHQNNQNVIVHPSREDSKLVNIEVGEVVQSFFGNYESRALDLALVRCNLSRKDIDKKSLTVVRSDDLNTNEQLKVRKTGRTTGKTEGYLMDTIPSVRVKNFKFQNCYHVVSDSDTIFFKEGDSGSGVFLIKDEEISKPVGIAFAFMTYSPHTFVCRMDGIIDILHLNLVMYPNENIAFIDYSQNNAVHEPMECSD